MRCSTRARAVVPAAPGNEPIAECRYACRRHQSCQLEGTETSVRRRFLGSASDKPLLDCVFVAGDA